MCLDFLNMCTDFLYVCVCMYVLLYYYYIIILLLLLLYYYYRETIRQQRQNTPPYVKKTREEKRMETKKVEFKDINIHMLYTDVALEFKATITHVYKQVARCTERILNCAYCGDKVETDIMVRTKKCPTCEETDPKSTIDKRYRYEQLILVTGEGSKDNLRLRRLSSTPLEGQFYPGQEVKVIGWYETDSWTKERYVYVEEIEVLKESDTPHRERRDSPEYKHWRKQVLNRDRMCQICDSTEQLEVHHIYDYKNYPVFRWDEGNGIVLCKTCHQKFHSYYGKNGVTPADLVRFIHTFTRG